MIDIDDLLGIPFVLHGRDKRGYDCYGLVLEVAKRFGHNMVDLYKEYSENNERDLDDNSHNIIYASNLVKTEKLTSGDILLFYDKKGRVCHIGVFLKNNDFIHCDGDGVHISDLSKYIRKWEAFTWL